MTKMKIPKKFYPYRIPYQGSKQRIAFKLMAIMAQKCPNAKYFFDVFGGGGAMSYAAAQFGLKVFYSDINQGIVNLHNFLKTNKIPLEWFSYVSKDQYVKTYKQSDPYSVAICHAWDLNSLPGHYLYSEQLSPLIKHFIRVLLENDQHSLQILKEHSKINLKLPKTSKLDTRLEELRSVLDRKLVRRNRLESLWRLYPWERLFAMAKLCLNNFDISFEVKNYLDLKIPDLPSEEVIIYCDPPYIGTTRYLSGQFDHAKFNKWFSQLPYTGFLSEFKAPFKEIAQFTRKTGIRRKGGNDTEQEKLFWNGK